MDMIRSDFSPTRAVILHGSYGFPEENWFPWLKSELETRGIKTAVPQFPTPEGQTLDAWLDILDRAVGVYDRNLILVGHSSGPAVILQKLQDLRGPIKASFLVSAFVGILGQKDFDPLNATFFERPLNWPVIRMNAGFLRVYVGDDDPYVPVAKAKEVATNLNAKLTVIHKGGHFNAAAGYMKFPQLLNDILVCLKSN